ncbi:MAG: O-acetyl-ADP-ribose deacetylase [SAR324 cluster bacterium]|nr:O-acetyl-ADP-ribose deacetylase [SAR324 cluster bacterium]
MGLQIIQGDITTLNVDAIVNAANVGLLGGSGVDGAIHLAAGSGLAEACKKVSPCPTGEARITPGFNLPARFIIHTVGPIWAGGGQGEAKLLAQAYSSTLHLASHHPIETLAFPSVSTGAYAFPLELAAPIALRAILKGLSHFSQLKQVVMVCYDDQTLVAYQTALANLAPKK